MSNARAAPSKSCCVRQHSSKLLDAFGYYLGQHNILKWSLLPPTQALLMRHFWEEREESCLALPCEWHGVPSLSAQTRGRDACFLTCASSPANSVREQNARALCLVFTRSACHSSLCSSVFTHNQHEDDTKDDDDTLLIALRSTQATTARTIVQRVATSISHDTLILSETQLRPSTDASPLYLNREGSERNTFV